MLALAAFAGLSLIGSSLYAVLSSSSSKDLAPALVDTARTPAPEFVLPEIGDPSNQVPLSRFRGKDVVVNFWASWCTPCRSEMPLLESTYRSERAKIEFVGIDTNDTLGSAQAFSKQVNVSYPLLFDPNGDGVATRFGLYGLPTTVFISRDGDMVGRHFGQLDAATLATALHLAFGTQVRS